MEIMAERREFVDVFAETGLKQPALAKEARLHQTTISKAVRGVGIERTTALQILHALNRLRKERGLSQLAFDEIEWHLIE